MVDFEVGFAHFYRMKGKGTKDEFHKLVGKRIRDLRKAKGYDAAEDLAYEKELPRSQYSRYEKGTNMRVDSLKKIMDALEVTPAEFFSEGFD